MHTQTPTETKTNTHTCFMDLTWCGCRPHWLHPKTDVVSHPPLLLHRLVLAPFLSSFGSVGPWQAPSSSRGIRDVLWQSSWHTERKHCRELNSNNVFGHDVRVPLLIPYLSPLVSGSMSRWGNKLVKSLEFSTCLRKNIKCFQQTVKGKQ